MQLFAHSPTFSGSGRCHCNASGFLKQDLYLDLEFEKNWIVAVKLNSDILNLTIFSYYNQNRFLTSPEWFFNSGGVWFDSGGVALTREMSGVCDGFYVSRGQKPNWTNVSRGTPKPIHLLRLPRASTKLYQHPPSIKTKPCLHLPSHQNHTYSTSTEWQNHTFSVLKPNHIYISRGTKPNHLYISRGTKPNHLYISRGTKPNRHHPTIGCL